MPLNTIRGHDILSKLPRNLVADNYLALSAGRMICAVTPGPSFGANEICPPWASTIERLIDNPIPMPDALVVKKAS